MRNPRPDKQPRPESRTFAGPIAWEMDERHHLIHLSPIYRCMDAWMYGCMDVWMHGCMDVWMHGWMDVWMYGWMDAWMHGCMDV